MHNSISVLINKISPLNITFCDSVKNYQKDHGLTTSQLRIGQLAKDLQNSSFSEVTTCPSNFKESTLGAKYLDYMYVGRAPYVRKHIPITSAPRCMSNYCWFPPARAYSLAIYVEESEVTRCVINKKSSESSDCYFISPLLSVEVEKTFSFSFASNKDTDHIKRGFERSLTTALQDMPIDEEALPMALESVHEFIGSLSGLEFKKGDVLDVLWLPCENHIQIYFNNELRGDIYSRDLSVGLHNIYFGNGDKVNPKYKPMFNNFIQRGDEYLNQKYTEIFK